MEHECGQNAEFYGVKRGGKHSYRWHLRGEITEHLDQISYYKHLNQYYEGKSENKVFYVIATK
jgi:hypothetical protein